jgi:hypothetical protein
MRFDSLDDLIRYIVTENINLKYSDVEFKTNLNADEKPAEEPKKEAIEVKIGSFYDKPVVEATIGDENILFVESYDALSNACGSGKVTLLGRTITTNLCEMDNVAHITLAIDMPGNVNYNVDFKLMPISEKADDQAIIQLKDTLVNAKAE